MKYTQWYYSRDLKPQGPVSFEDMKGLIVRGQIGPRDLISAQEDGRWLMAQEWGVFATSLFPAAQKCLQGSSGDLEAREWVLLVEDAEKRVLQEGPLSLAEIFSGVRERRISPEQFIWKSGLSGWSRIADRPEFLGAEVF